MNEETDGLVRLFFLSLLVFIGMYGFSNNLQDNTPYTHDTVWEIANGDTVEVIGHYYERWGSEWVEVNNLSRYNTEVELSPTDSVFVKKLSNRVFELVRKN